MHPRKIQDPVGDQRSAYVLEADIGYFYVIFTVGMGLIIDTTTFCSLCVKTGFYTAKGDFCTFCMTIILDELLTNGRLSAVGCTLHPFLLFPLKTHV